MKDFLKNPDNRLKVYYMLRETCYEVNIQHLLYLFKYSNDTSSIS